MVITYFNGLELEIPEGVYEPGEDSELLARSLEIKKGEKVLDMGTGSGALGLLAAKENAEVTAVDIKNRAVKIAGKNAEINGIEINVKKSNLFNNVKNSYDVIIFNPPYLPVEKEDKIWSGGKDGSNLIRRFAKEVSGYLKPNGKIFMVISSLTGPEKIKEIFQENGFEIEVKDRSKIPFEELVVLKIKKKKRE